MRVAFIGDYSPDKTNGVSTSTYLLSKYLVRSGVQVFFYNKSNFSKTETDPNGIIKKSFLKTFGVLSLDLFKTLKNNPDKIDIYHIHSVFTPLNTLVSICLNILKQPYVITPHGGYNTNVFKKNSFLKYIYFCLFEYIHVRRASAIICVSESEVADIKRFNYNGKISVIPNAIEKPFFTPMKPDIPKNAAYNIIYLGRYDIKHKGLDILMQIFKEINSIMPTAQLTTYGKGPDRKKILESIKQNNIRNVFIEESIYGDKKNEVLQNADLYIQCSRWEVFGVSIFEASMAGLPVALSGECGVKHFFSKKKLGIILEKDTKDAADQICNLLQNLKLRNDIRNRAPQEISEYLNPVKVASSTLELYKEIKAL